MKEIIILALCILFVELTYAQITTDEIPVGLTVIDNVLRRQTTLQLSTPDMDVITKEDEFGDRHLGPLRFAYPVSVNYTLNNSGKWEELEDGSRLWRLTVRLRGALSTNASYDKFWIPKGGKFFVYNEDTRQYIGAITSKFIESNIESPYSFSTGLIYGETVTFEYYQPVNIKDSAVISISRIDYGYRYVDSPHEIQPMSFGDAGSCQVNINCPEGDNWQNEKKATARVLIVSSVGSGWCSCSLINNTNNDNTPYALIANHCLQDSYGNQLFDAITNSNASQWIFYWDYEHSGCGNSSTQPTIKSTTGATVTANNSLSDFALLRLTQNPLNLSNFTPYYLGWDCSGNSGTGGVGIHHPRGDVKKISTHNYTLQTYNTNYWLLYWMQTPNGHSITEGGSSGSPLINNNRHVIGQLLGTHGGDCSNPANKNSIYGKFSVSWTGDGASDSRRKLQPWLDPAGTNPTTLSGIGVYEPTVDGVDLIVRDNEEDVGDEPNTTTDVSWASPDIWLEDLNGNVVSSANANEIYNVCVRIRNRGNETSPGEEQKQAGSYAVASTAAATPTPAPADPDEPALLFVHWAKAGLSVDWPRSWFDDPDNYYDCNGNSVPRGGLIEDPAGSLPTVDGGLILPAIGPGQEYIARIPWLTPDGNMYRPCSEFDGYESELWHYCLLARIYDEHQQPGEDMQPYPLWNFVMESNNVASKNVTVIGENGIPAGVVGIDNPYEDPMHFTIRCNILPNEYKERLPDYAELYLQFSPKLYDSWVNGGSDGWGFDEVEQNKFLIYSIEGAEFHNIELHPGELHSILSEVRFFAPDEPKGEKFEFDLIQKTDAGEVTGGERFTIVREDGLFPQAVERYSLANSNVNDSISISTVQNTINSVAPNPATAQVTVAYSLSAGTVNASLQVINLTGTKVVSFPLKSTSSEQLIPLSGWNAGYYTVQMIVDGAVADSKALVVQ